jgi:Flp pilus assembly protein TadB
VVAVTVAAAVARAAAMVSNPTPCATTAASPSENVRATRSFSQPRRTSASAHAQQSKLVAALAQPLLPLSRQPRPPPGAGSQPVPQKPPPALLLLLLLLPALLLLMLPALLLPALLLLLLLLLPALLLPALLLPGQPRSPAPAPP